VLLEAARSKREGWEVREALLAVILIQQQHMMDDGIPSETIVKFDIAVGRAILDWIYEIAKRKIRPIDKKRDVFRDE
jgi:hypothetical protein